MVFSEKMMCNKIQRAVKALWNCKKKINIYIKSNTEYSDKENLYKGKRKISRHYESYFKIGTSKETQYLTFKMHFLK